MFFIPKTYTVESVTSGHPDKMCDQISDAILDECIRQDPFTRAGIETFGNHGLLVIGGEVTTKADINAAEIAKKVYKDIGYAKDFKIITGIIKQSPDIAQGVDTGGAGDQGIMYGFASDETPEFLPLAVVKVHALAKGLENLRKQGYANLAIGSSSFADPNLTNLNSGTGTVNIEDCPEQTCTLGELAKIITVQVKWNEQGDNKQVEVTTLISEGGIGH